MAVVMWNIQKVMKKINFMLDMKKINFIKTIFTNS